MVIVVLDNGVKPSCASLVVGMKRSSNYLLDKPERILKLQPKLTDAVYTTRYLPCVIFTGGKPAKPLTTVARFNNFRSEERKPPR
jgi:hypothetical protein